MEFKKRTFSFILLVSACALIENDAVESENNQMQNETEIEENAQLIVEHDLALEDYIERLKLREEMDE